MKNEEEKLQDLILKMKSYNFGKFLYVKENNVIRIYPDEGYKSLVNDLNVYLEDKYILDESYDFVFDLEYNIISNNVIKNTFYWPFINILPDLIKLVLKHEEYIIFMCEVYPTFRMISNGAFGNDISLDFDNKNRYAIISRSDMEENKYKELYKILPI
jgi:hypothetical protein